MGGSVIDRMRKEMEGWEPQATPPTRGLRHTDPAPMPVITPANNAPSMLARQKRNEFMQQLVRERAFHFRRIR